VRGTLAFIILPFLLGMCVFVGFAFLTGDYRISATIGLPLLFAIMSCGLTYVMGVPVDKKLHPSSDPYSQQLRAQECERRAKECARQAMKGARYFAGALAAALLAAICANLASGVLSIYHLNDPFPSTSAMVWFVVWSGLNLFATFRAMVAATSAGEALSYLEEARRARSSLRDP
jgi:hypothetical protein